MSSDTLARTSMAVAEGVGLIVGVAFLNFQIHTVAIYIAMHLLVESTFTRLSTDSRTHLFSRFRARV